MIRIIGALLLATLLGGCSAIKLGYNNLDDLAYWWLDGYLDFSREQSPQVRDELARLLAWHRSNEMPVFADMLSRMEKMASADMTAEQACSYFSEARTRLGLVAERAEPAVVATVLGLSREQVSHMDRKFKSNSEEYVKEWVEVSTAKRRERRFDQQLDRVESIYGRLDDPARAALREQIAQSVYDPRKNLAEQTRRHQDFVRTMGRIAEGGMSPAQAREQMRAMLDRALNPPDPAYRAYQDTLALESCRAFATAHNLATPGQRETAARRIRAYEQAFRELAARK